jgi:3-dehydroquinate synthase
MEPVIFTAEGFTTRISFEEEVSLSLPSDGHGLLYVFDTNTHRLFAADARPLVTIPAGEEAKSWSSVEKILQAGLANALDRKGTLAGVGGGVVGDVVAFAASIYMRGIRVVLFPTTLLAMVDAAVGGKTGINFGGYKNMVGSFLPAEEVRIGLASLASLPEREYRSGLAEVIKTAALGDEELFELLEARRDLVEHRDLAVMGEVVRRCVVVKTDIVAQDLTESGIRAFLNLGHTFAHALESASGLGALTHGEAVVWGMGRAVRLGVRLGITDPAYADRLLDLLRAYGFATRFDGLDEAALLEAMGKDKKTSAGALRFVFQRSLGDNLVESVPREEVAAVLREK